jgi:hypothetical protein
MTIMRAVATTSAVAMVPDAITAAITLAVATAAAAEATIVADC